jgi:transposase
VNDAANMSRTRNRSIAQGRYVSAVAAKENESEPDFIPSIFSDSLSRSERQPGAIVLRQKWSRGQVELANMSPCLIGMEACVGAHHLSRKLKVQQRLDRLPHGLWQLL